MLCMESFLNIWSCFADVLWITLLLFTVPHQLSFLPNKIPSEHPNLFCIQLFSYFFFSLSFEASCIPTPYKLKFVRPVCLFCLFPFTLIWRKLIDLARIESHSDWDLYCSHSFSFHDFCLISKYYKSSDVLFSFFLSLFVKPSFINSFFPKKWLHLFGLISLF